MGREDDAEASYDRANPVGRSAGGFGFPGAADHSQKIAAVPAGFGEDFVAAAAVVTDARSTNKDRRFFLQASERVDQNAGGVDAAVAQNLFAGFGPAALGQVSAAEMDDRVITFHGGNVDDGAGGSPGDITGRGRFFPANHVIDDHTVGTQRSGERGTDQAAAARD